MAGETGAAALYQSDDTASFSEPASAEGVTPATEMDRFIELAAISTATQARLAREFKAAAEAGARKQRSHQPLGAVAAPVRVVAKR